VVFTTIDGQLQKETEAVIAKRLQEVEAWRAYPHRSRKDAVEAGDANYLQAAVVVLDHRNGGILALAGGRDYTTSNFNRALLARRQAGSVVKPFIFAHAVMKGLNPRSRVSDARLNPSEIPRRYGPYDPANSDRKYEGNRPATDVVVHSRNTMTVRIGLQAGLEGTAQLLKRAGITENPPLFPSLFLGAFETNLRDLTSAMTVFPNAGNQVHPFVIREIQDINGRVLYRHREIRTPLLEQGAAQVTYAAMEEVFTRGTAAASKALGHKGKAAGKTGTTNNFQDAWFVGSAENLTAGVWVGFDKPRQIYDGGGGAQVALPIWVDILNSRAASPYRR
jgi:penicillin-binding protein 1A